MFMYISLTISIYLYNRKVPLKPGFLYAIKKSTIHAGAGEFGCKSVRKTLSESEVKAVDALIGETGTLASYRFFFDVVPESAIQGTDNKAQVWIGERGNQYGAKPGEQSGKLPLLSDVIPSLENDYNTDAPMEDD